jgi:hypothetical protein
MYIVTMVFATLRAVGADLTVAAPPNLFRMGIHLVKIHVGFEVA